MKYLVLGHGGMVGSAIVRAAIQRGYPVETPRVYQGCDFTSMVDTEQAMWSADKDTTVFLCAGKVGGISANIAKPADFIRINLQIATNVIELTHRCGAKLVYLGSSCIYPATAPCPIREECLLTGPLEPSNEAYAVAKIAGIKMCEAYHRQYGLRYLALMPCNLYGPGDHYEPWRSHVIPALIRKFHEAKTSGAEVVTVWGSGRPRREFLHVDDMADAALHLVEAGATGLINVGCRKDLSIAELAILVALVVGYQRNVNFDRSQPDGVFRKLLDVSKLDATGWTRGRDLLEGLQQTYAAYLETL